MNHTAHNIVQLNQKTVYGSEVAFCIWRIGWSGGLVLRYCYCNSGLYCCRGRFLQSVLTMWPALQGGHSAMTLIIMLGLSDPCKWRLRGLSNSHKHSPKCRASELWRSAYILTVAMENRELENFLRYQHSSNAAICRRLYELCIQYRGFAIFERNSLLRVWKLEIYQMCLKCDGWYRRCRNVASC